MLKIIIYSKSEEKILNLTELLTGFFQQLTILTFSNLVNLADYIKLDAPNLMVLDYRNADMETQNIFVNHIKATTSNNNISIIYLFETELDRSKIMTQFEFGKDEVLRSPIDNFEFRVRIESTVSNLALKKEKLSSVFEISKPSQLDLSQTETYLIKMAEVINHIPTAIIITDKKAKIEYVNAYFLTVTGYGQDEIIGQNAMMLMALDNPEFVINELKSTANEGETWKGELMNRRKDGSQFWSEIVIAPVQSNDNCAHSFVATMTDFTEKINTQTELEELCTQLQINEVQATQLNQELIEQKQEIQVQRDELSQQKEQLEKQNDKLLKQRKSITASLEYALRIQQAMMAQQSELKDLFPESFLFYLPRDFISGDFYWYRQLDKHRSIVVAVDCTGHGIPGAFMSMLGSSLLSQIIEQNKVYEPEQILDQLDTGIVRALNQNITNNCDGMEVALVLVDRQKKEIQFAGAGLPLAYLKDGVLEFIRGSKRPIGGLQVPNLHKQSYTTHTMPLEEGMTFYLFSDGYADQFDKAGKRKFLIKNFRDLLSELKDKPMDDQFGHLFDTLINWKGKQKQTDDILVLGFKV